MKTTAPPISADRLFRAFADRTRLRLLHLLGAREWCVGDLVDILRLPQAKVSRHLAYLRKAGLVEVREEGLWNFYSLAPAEEKFHRKLLECLGACFGGVPELVKDRKRAGLMRAKGGCCP